MSVVWASRSGGWTSTPCGASTRVWRRCWGSTEPGGSSTSTRRWHSGRPDPAPVDRRVRGPDGGPGGRVVARRRPTREGRPEAVWETATMVRTLRRSIVVSASTVAVGTLVLGLAGCTHTPPPPAAVPGPVATTVSWFGRSTHTTRHWSGSTSSRRNGARRTGPRGVRRSPTCTAAPVRRCDPGHRRLHVLADHRRRHRHERRVVLDRVARADAPGVWLIDDHGQG